MCYFFLTLFIFLRKTIFFLQDQIPEFFTIVFRSHFSISFRFYDECYIYQIKMFERHNLLANRFEIIKEKFNKRTCYNIASVDVWGRWKQNVDWVYDF